MWDVDGNGECEKVDGFLRAIIPQRLHARLPEFVHLVARFCMGAERRRLAMIAFLLPYSCALINVCIES